jgi:MFS family permease
MEKSNIQSIIYLLKNRDFSFFLSTRFLVIFSLYMQTTVVSYLLYKLTKDPLTLGLVGLAEVIPAFIGAVFAGYYVDRNEKRKMYLYCLVFYLINSIFFIGITSHVVLDYLSVHYFSYLVYFGMFISGIIRSFLAPASFSLLPLLINENQLTHAITWSSTTWMLGSILGPLAGGILMAIIGVTPVMIFVAIGIAISVISMLQVKPKPFISKLDIGIRKGLQQGFHFVFKTQIILAVLCLDLFAVLFGGAEALLPVFSADILKVGEIGFGCLRSAHGIGSIFLLVILSYLPLKTNIGIKMMVSIFGFGVCIILFGISTNFYLSFFCLFMAGLFDAVSVMIRHSILQLKTPVELKGRVSSINMMFISSSNELGAFESGVMARLLGTVPSVALGGVMTILVAIIAYFAAPQLRKLNKLQD